MAAALAQFLANRAVNASRTVLVAGNEAADVDSLVSALALAFVWDTLRPGQHAVPYAACPAREFRLRGDARSLFARAGVPVGADGAPAGVLFADRLPAWLAEHGADVDLALTDHNAPSAGLKAVLPQSAVVAVVDHHADAGLFPDAAPRVVDPACGSASSLVAEIALDAGVALPPDLVTLLLGAILLDTRNFDPGHNRFSERDVAVHARLTHDYPCPDLDGQRKWFEELIEARFDVAGLDAGDLLRLDFKSAAAADGPFKGRPLGFASIMGSLDDLAACAGHAGLEEDMSAMMREKGLDALVCLTKKQKTPAGKRKAVTVLSSDEALADALTAALAGKGLPQALLANPLFQAQGVDRLGFGPEPAPRAGASVRTFYIRAEGTRKTLMPAMLALI